MIDKHVAEPRDWRNKAFEYRKNSATLRIEDFAANHWTNNSPLKSNRAHSDLITNNKLKTFDKRSKSLLPPIYSDEANFDSVSSAQHINHQMLSPLQKIKQGDS